MNNGNTEKDNNTLIEFWDKAFAMSEEDMMQEKETCKDSWSDLAPSEKLFKAAVSLGSAGKVLDYGCGSGWAGIIAAKSGCSDVTAVDVSPGAAKAAAFYADLFDVADKVHVSCVSPSWMADVPSCTYDGFICSNVLDVVPAETAQDIIRQSARVVRPGASVIIGLNYYLSPETAASKGLDLVAGNRLYVDGVLRLVSLSDEEWTARFSDLFDVERLEHFAWPGEKSETRRLFYLRKKN